MLSLLIATLTRTGSIVSQTECPSQLKDALALQPDNGTFVQSLASLCPSVQGEHRRLAGTADNRAKHEKEGRSCDVGRNAVNGLRKLVRLMATSQAPRQLPRLFQLWARKVIIPNEERLITKLSCLQGLSAWYKAFCKNFQGNEVLF